MDAKRTQIIRHCHAERAMIKASTRLYAERSGEVKNFMILTESVRYIEANLCEPITREDVAEHCYVSLSALEKLFCYALHLSVTDYIVRRRMTQAARDLVQGGARVTDTAMNYQYGSVEVFSRVFKRVWNISPSEFRRSQTFTGIFPKINFEHREGEDLYMARKRVDMSEAYDFLKSNAGSYVLCFDMQHMTRFNEVSRRAGDLAIVEMAARLERAALDDMLVLRIGGDEFAVITGLHDRGAAEALTARVLAHNGEPVMAEGRALPMSLWCGMVRIPQQLKYDELFDEMHKAIDASKQ